MSNDDFKSRSANPFASSGGAPAQPQQSAAQSFNPFAQPQQGGAASGSTNPFGSASGSNASANPFASNSAAPAASADPSSSFNPFAMQQKSAPSPLGAQGLNNPLINPASATPASAPLSANPLAPANPVAPAGSAGAAPASASLGLMNPFDQAAPAGPAPSASNSLAASRLAGQSEANVFDAPPSPAVSDPFANIPSAVATESADPSEFGYSSQEAEQIRNLAPLEFAPAQVEVEDLGELPDIAAGYIKKQNVKMIVIGASAAALLFGLLIGVMMKERRMHNVRVSAWKKIESEIAEPLSVVDSLDKNIQKQLEELSKNQRVPWEMNDQLPEKIALVNSEVLAPLVPIEPAAMRELSDLVIQMNLLFTAVQEHRLETKRLAADFKSQGQSKAFSSHKMYAIDVSNFLSRCSKRGRLTCRQHQAKPASRIVAIDKLGSSQSEVLPRYERKTVKVDTNGLVPLQRGDVLGRVNPTTSYVDKLGQLKKSLEQIQELRASFQITLDKKRAITEVIAL